MPRPPHSVITTRALCGVALYFAAIAVFGAISSWAGMGEGVVISSWIVGRGPDAGLGVLALSVALLVVAAAVVSRGTRRNSLIAGAIVLAAAIVNIGYGVGLPVAPDDSDARGASSMAVGYGSWLVALALGVALTRPRAAPPSPA